VGHALACTLEHPVVVGRFTRDEEIECSHLFPRSDQYGR
jgi:hypothetical protein